MIAYVPRRKVSLVNTILLSILFISNSAGAIENRLIRCASYLISQAKFHKVPTLSERYTKDALSDLHQFRVRELAEFDPNPSSAAVDADFTSRPSLREKVAGRIVGLRKEGMDQIAAEDDSAKRQIVAATAFEGAENILAELDQRLAIAQQATEDQGDLHSLGTWGYAPIGGLWAGAAAYAATHYVPDVNWHLQVVALAALGWGIRFIPEIIFGMFRQFHWRERQETSLKAVVQQLQAGQWYYSSRDLKFPARVIKEIWRMNGISQQNLNSFMIWITHPKRTVQLTGNFAMLDPTTWGTHEPDRSTWVRLDEVLFWNPLKEQPELIVTVRISEEIPKYPKVAPQKEEEVSESHELATLPIRAK
jgi:hypothetical protein